LASVADASAEPESLTAQTCPEEAPIPVEIQSVSQPFETAVVVEASPTLADIDGLESAGRLRRKSAREEFFARHNRK
jgi:hypothetical protein